MNDLLLNALEYYLAVTPRAVVPAPLERAMRKIHKVDANQKEIVEALRQLGAGVLVLSGVGDGAPDLAVGFREQNYFLELKTGVKSMLTETEKTFQRSWPGHYSVVYSVDDALRVIGAI